MNTKSIIEIFRGDDSDALGYQTIVGTIHTDLDLTGCKAVFRYLGFFQEFDPIPEDGKLTIVIPSASSMQFPPGFGYASLKVYDIDRKVRTFTNRIPVFVKTMTPCRGGGEFDVEFSPFPELAPLKIFVGPNADDFDLYTGFISKIIDRASAQKYGLSMLFDAMDAEKTAEGGCAASPAAVKAAYDAVIGVLTDNYYTKTETDEAIDKLAAYYITSDAQGNPFATHSALVNATTYYSGGSVRVPTRNDYAIVIADETHDNEEWRYIYSENAQGVGQWEPQYAVEGVITFDDNVTRTSGNGVKSSGIWSAIWGALSALPTGFTSLYDWCVAQIAKLRDKLDLNVYSFGNASVTFLRGYSITDGDVTYRSGGTGGVDETIEFYGPITSTVQQQYVYWVPYDYKDTTDFNPSAQSIWCLFANVGDVVPKWMMYRTGPVFTISNWGTTAPTLTLNWGEESGGHPTMARPLVATGDTLAKASQLASKANDADVVHKTGDEYINGNKTFNGAMTTANINALGAVSANGITIKTGFNLNFTGGGNVLMDGGSILIKSGFEVFSRVDGSQSPQFVVMELDDEDASIGQYSILLPFANGTIALTSAIPYSLVTKTISNGAVTLDDRAINAVAVSSSLASLTVNFPTATSGKVRDFGLRLTVASGITTAPELALPQGVTCENADGEAPEIGADGAATILYFTETASGVFLVKGEVLQTITA